MRIERCRENCYDISNLQSAGKQLSPKFSRWKINVTQVYNFTMCLCLKNILAKV